MSTWLSAAAGSLLTFFGSLPRPLLASPPMCCAAVDAAMAPWAAAAAAAARSAPGGTAQQILLATSINKGLTCGGRCDEHRYAMWLMLWRRLFAGYSLFPGGDRNALNDMASIIRRALSSGAWTLASPEVTVQLPSPSAADQVLRQHLPAAERATCKHTTAFLHALLLSAPPPPPPGGASPVPASAAAAPILAQFEEVWFPAGATVGAAVKMVGFFFFFPSRSETWYA